MLKSVAKTLLELKRFFCFVHWPAWLLLSVSLGLLRWQLLREIGITIPAAWENGLGLGFHSDFAAALIPVTLAWVALGLFALPRAVGFSLLAFLVWLATWSNLVYLTHFGVSLDWWVIRFHLGDLGDVRGNATQIGVSWRIVVSFLFMAAATSIYIWRERGARLAARQAREVRQRGSALYRGKRGRISALGAALSAFLGRRALLTAQATGIVLLFFAFQQSPRAFHIYSIGHPVNSHVLKLWYVQNFTHRPFSGLESEVGEAFGRRVQAARGRNPGLVLAKFRDFHEGPWDAARPAAGLNGQSALNGTYGTSGKRFAASPNGTNGNLFSASSNGTGAEPPRARFASHTETAVPGPSATRASGAASADWPLLRDFAPDPERTRALRRELGLPEQGPINVIVLLVEGFRWYELKHPYIGPRVHPRINRLMEKNGLVFSQGYSSSSSAGQTVRGSFSTFCSFLPNIKGPATYIAYSTVRIRCLPEVMKENGYATLWFNSHRKNSHNKSFFEGSNGVDHFYDREFFLERGITEKVGDWGLGDQPVMKASLEKILEWGKGEKPVYVQIVTVSTHTPVAPAPRVRFDEEFERILSEDPEYRNFMSMFRYTDEAVGDFLEGLFATEMGKSTVVFLAGDHSNGGVPVGPLAMDRLQYLDSRFRVPMVVLTANMPRPQVRFRVVNQMDIAPSAATIAGVHAKVTWLGRGLFHPGGESTPWVFSSKGKVYWRTATRGCYAGACYDLSASDPTMESNPPAVAAMPELDRFFNTVIDSGGVAIGNNRISPIN